VRFDLAGHQDGVIGKRTLEEKDHLKEKSTHISQVETPDAFNLSPIVLGWVGRDSASLQLAAA